MRSELDFEGKEVDLNELLFVVFCFRRWMEKDFLEEKFMIG